MNSNKNRRCVNRKRLEIISCVLSSAGCSWITNETSDFDDTPTNSSLSLDDIPLLRVTHPSFSLADDHHEQLDDTEGNDNISSTQQKELVQSKASKLMSRTRVYSHRKGDNTTQPSQHPRRVMLENILDSFDQLVDARIRAYARILRNHIRVLWESDNARGARIAEYKLQTLLEVAANHLSFDSISTKFKITTTENVVTNDDSINTSSTSTAVNGETTLSLPIELIVEIRSPRFFHQGLESNNRNDVALRPHECHQGSLRFRAKGVIRERPCTWGNDTGRCSTPVTSVCRNSKAINRICSIYQCQNIEIDIDCNDLLSQMIEEASKVVMMAVELTNLAWTNNSHKEEEYSEISMNEFEADNRGKVTNIIVDDDDDDDNIPAADERSGERTSSKRSRHGSFPETISHGDSKMSKQVSELSFRPNDEVVRDDKLIEEPRAAGNSASTTTVTTITNLHILDEVVDRKTRYFVSDPSYDSSGSEHDTSEVCQDEKRPPLDGHDEDENNNDISAERACHIVDFVLAGDIIPSSFSSNKRLRTK